MVKLQVRRRRRTNTPRERRAPGTLQTVLGWCVHAYTALGLVAAGMIAVLLVRGGPADFRWSFLLMLAATVVDATDGTLARRVRIKEAVPGFDGRRLDDIIDFLTYTFLPLRLDLARGPPAGRVRALAVPAAPGQHLRLLPGPGQDRRRLLPRLPVALERRGGLSLRPAVRQWASLAIVITLAILTFVPSKYLYPSLPGRFNRVHVDPGHPLDDLAGLDHLPPARQLRPGARPDDAHGGVGLAELSHPATSVRRGTSAWRTGCKRTPAAGPEATAD